MATSTSSSLRCFFGADIRNVISPKGGIKIHHPSCQNNLSNRDVSGCRRLLQLLRNPKPEVVLLQRQMGQQLVDAFHSPLQIGPHLEQLPLSSAVSNKHVEGLVHVFDDDGLVPRLLEKPKDQPLVEGVHHHVVVKSRQNHLDHFRVRRFCAPNQVDACHRRHALVGDHHVNGLGVQDLQGFLRARCHMHVERLPKGRSKGIQVGDFVVHVQDMREACHLSRPSILDERHPWRLARQPTGWPRPATCSSWSIHAVDGCPTR